MRLYRTRYLGVMILLIWLGSFGALVPTLLGVWGKFALDEEIGSCSILKGENGTSPKKFLFIIAFVLPCCAIIVCYARIFFIVRKATANLRPVEIPSSAGNVNHTTILRRSSARPSIAVIHQRGKMTNKDRKLLWMILVIFGAFVVCYLPITIFKAVVKHTNSTWNIFGYLLIYMTTCINPLVYVLMSSDYRQAYTNLFLCRKDWNLSSRTSNSNKT
ncbi:G-protein coupled receptor moody [Orchesella cincta]|uniref:G-protein coupled receptor moody n=1 Tax=Orchesella cincta TaxID=48709 RepID=A0A1D2N985_ORCCI|nr:G-protein coupled receptor moody [Orchesella cincta]